ncbi:hypothetical protein ACH95_19490 [Bacillus glycinifermentans]|uniref:Uncharacterized protein n=1 Tax=Bacillus glycinifermentans TaxID=1664069 RepID=A0A0J6H6P2_9BACI|nr:MULTISPECIES: hypothetical protein [Bacillus]ATH91576.1 hypothetical protein COP00_02310 [Bacillus glycinifermentans]KMM54877.1 hypothetical protein ACH95_19490 [Bacillus glycinifermentans]KRT93801.1 hypothetical protein AB447_216980 [Bacillus glycinifermentans]MDU0072028.1 hypothetical protein [Bacillus sp. IG6]MEC0487374.1 hypothetical protein [Bacillus glycinifermentans]
MCKNHVYGTIQLEVSRASLSNKKDLAVLESYYAISDERVDLSELTLVHKNGKRLGTVKVHNVKISWDEFGKGEYRK